MEVSFSFCPHFLRILSVSLVPFSIFLLTLVYPGTVLLFYRLFCCLLRFYFPLMLEGHESSLVVTQLDPAFTYLASYSFQVNNFIA